MSEQASLITYPYNRDAAVAYALKWAYSRNPAFYDFEDLGGDCTNFASQCLLAGGALMNFTPTYGWYYRNLNDRAPAWTSVEYLYRFLTTNEGVGPFGHEVDLPFIRPGDIIQLMTVENRFHHSPIVVKTGILPTLNNTLVAAHSYDARNRPLSTYNIKAMRCIHIDGLRKWA